MIIEGTVKLSSFKDSRNQEIRKLEIRKVENTAFFTH